MATLVVHGHIPLNEVKVHPECAPLLKTRCSESWATNSSLVLAALTQPMGLWVLASEHKYAKQYLLIWATHNSLPNISVCV